MTNKLKQFHVFKNIDSITGEEAKKLNLEVGKLVQECSEIRSIHGVRNWLIQAKR